MAGLLFFFYGTLRQDHDNPVTRAILPLLQPCGVVSVHGQLFAIRSGKGWYPALKAGSGRVQGRLYRAGPTFRARHLRLLDRYEQYDPQQPSRSEYLRKVTQVRRARLGVLKAQVYWHRGRRHPGMARIASGDFTSFARARGLRAYGEIWRTSNST
jgi:gamma-glutamylcyclotransferase (GGCT)/AIG2-like uncharacterized protein YtfP